MQIELSAVHAEALGKLEKLTGQSRAELLGRALDIFFEQHLTDCVPEADGLEDFLNKAETFGQVGREVRQACAA